MPEFPQYFLWSTVDHSPHFREDVALMVDMGLQSSRFLGAKRYCQPRRTALIFSPGRLRAPDSVLEYA